jgi:hypothetical protein
MPVFHYRKKKKSAILPQPSAEDLFHCYNAKLAEENMSQLQKLIFVATKQE